MKRTLLGLVLGLALGATVTAQADDPEGPDPHHCGALVVHVSHMLDQTHIAWQGLYRQPPRVIRAQLLLTRVSDEWPRFWELAKECSPQH